MEYDHNWQANNNSRKYMDDLIERDKPKKPTQDGNTSFNYCYCPNCGSALSFVCDIPECIEDDFNFCKNCGQRIDWSDR